MSRERVEEIKERVAETGPILNREEVALAATTAAFVLEKGDVADRMPHVVVRDLAATAQFLFAENARLLSLVSSGQKDAERLDWLCADMTEATAGQRFAEVKDRYWFTKGLSAREAIDAAILAEKSEAPPAKSAVAPYVPTLEEIEAEGDDWKDEVATPVQPPLSE